MKYVLVVAFVVSLLQVMQPTLPSTYYPEVIDSIWESTHTAVQVSGTVAALNVSGEELHFRLGDRHGHFIDCVAPRNAPQPLVGAELIVFGLRKAYPVSERGQGVVEINPVHRVEVVEE